MKKFLICLPFFLLSLAIFSSSTNYFSSIYQDLLDGKPSGVVVYPDGTFSLSTDFGQAVSLPSSPISSFASNSTIFVGTASESSLLKIEGGNIQQISTFEEAMVTAITTAKEKIFVGTASPARIYEIKLNGEKKLLSELSADLVNSILTAPNGDLIVATGKPAKIFLLSQNGEIKKSIQIPADHSRTLFLFKESYYLGTSNPPSLYRFDLDLNPILLASFEGEEVTSICSLNNLLILSVNSKKDKENGQLYSYSENSGVSSLGSFSTLLNSLWSNGKEVFLGSANGSLYLFNGAKIGLCKKFEKGIVQLCGNGNNPQIFFSSPPSFASPLRSASSAYNSPVIDCGGISKIGSVKWEISSSHKVFIRAGNTTVPDPFWTKWTSTDNLNSIPPSRYYQWRIEFGEKANSFKGITIAVKPVNRPPKIENVKIHPPGEIYVKNIAQLGDRLVQDIHQKERAFPEIAQSRPYDSGTQTYYLYGFRMVSFSVSDPDNDDVRVKIEIKPENSKFSFILTENLKENYFTFDARTLPDGNYSLIITASDFVSNGAEEAKYDVYEVPLFEIDNTPPQITMSEENGLLKFYVKDNSSVRSGRLSRNGELWSEVESDGKVFGAKDATFTVKLNKDDKWVVFQAVDSFGNFSNSSWIRKN
ncbi:MAG: hypothetical protein GYA35_00905 [Thermoanaerobaculaceae bacterium]|nr:hypothetical protein [Thermoanaerobaculaceae bacterium]